ncbi:MAG: DUF1801 domain-containing protein [Sphaerochaeta sp.]
MRSEVTTVEAYLSELTNEQRSVIEPLRKLILENLPEGIQESINWGMISYEIPLRTFPDTYNKQPLGYAALSVQKHGFSLYLMPLYMDDKNHEKLQRQGKKLMLGKSCIRFKTLEDLPLDFIKEILRSYTVESYIQAYKVSRATS